MRRLIVITGLSGSGKSLAANCLEDLGMFCVDNLPVALIQPFYQLIQRGGEQLEQAAMVIDARERTSLSQFPDILENLRSSKSVPVQVLFFECDDDVLKRRYSETRRPHPLANKAPTLEEALSSEREALAPLREVADRIIDTSRFTSHELRAFLRNTYGVAGKKEVPNVNVMSFGFKYGVPAEVDLLFDVRFLPNPYFEPELRHLNGTNAEVVEFIDRTPEVHDFFKHLTTLLEFLVPLYGAEGKSYLIVGIACTGGKHRSVMLSERLAAWLRERDWPTAVTHRDLGKE